MKKPSRKSDLCHYEGIDLKCVLRTRVIKICMSISLLTLNAVDEIVDGDDVKVLIEQLDDAVTGDVAAATGHEDVLAMAVHCHVHVRSRLQRRVH